MALYGQPRILFLDTLYSKFAVATGLDRKPEAGDTYEREMARVTASAFGTSDAMSSALRELGWHAEDVLSNARTLQTLWAQESGNGGVIPFGWGRGWRLVTLPIMRSWTWRLPHIQGVIQKRVESERPDVLYVQDLELLGDQQLKSIKKYVGLLVGQSAVGMPGPEILRHYDLIVSSLPSNIERAKSMGIRTLALAQAFDARVLEGKDAVARDLDVSFVGTFSSRHGSTEALLRAVGEVCPTLRVFGAITPRALKRSGLEPFYAGTAWGRDMYKVMRRSKIALNRHIALAGPYAANMRMFEATGCGALLLTETRANLPDFFRPGREVVTYTSVEDAALQAAVLLSDPALLEEVARAGQLRTLTDHTYATRMAVLSAELQRLIT